MARKRTSTAEDLVDIVATLPWWAGVVLAALAWVLFSVMATMKGSPTAVVFGAIAGVLRYVAPLLFLVGSLMSVLRRHERKRLIGEAATDGPAAIERMTWGEFEAVIGEAFRGMGWRVAESGGGGPDGGVDLVLTREGKTALVQCKHWKVYSVGVKVVRELNGVMAARGSAAGFIVTSGKFTAEAIAFARECNVTLVDGDTLARWFARARAAQAPRDRGAPAGSPPAPPAATPNVPAPPACPVCTRPMVKRTAARGANAGQAFWGCAAFPSCRGTRPAA